MSHAATALQRLVYGLEAGVLQPGDCAAGLGSATSNSSIATQAAPNGMSRPRAPDGAAGASRGAVARCTVSQLRARLAEQLTSPALAVAVADVVRACHLAPPPPLPIPPAAAALASSASSCASCGRGSGGSAGARSSGGGSSASCSPCSCCSPAASPASSSSPRSTSPRSSLDMARGPATGSGGTDSSLAWSEGHAEDATGSKGGASSSSGGSSSSSSSVRTTAAALLGRARRACSGHACVASVLGMASGAAESGAADVAAGCGITAAASAAPSLLSTPHGACVLGRSSRYLYLMLWCAHDSAAAPGMTEPQGSEAEGADEHLACPGAGPAGVLRLVAALEASQLVEVLCAAYLDTPAPAPPPPPTTRPQPPTQPLQPAADAGSASAGSIRGRVLTQKELRKQKAKARGAKPHTAAATADAKSSAQQPGDARLAAGSIQAVEEQDEEGTEADPHTALVRSLRHGLGSLAHATSLLATLASSLNATAAGRTGSACGSSACLSGFGCSCGAALGMPCRSVELPPAPVAVRAAQLLLAPSAQRLQVSLLCHLAKGAALAAAAGMALEASPWQPWCFGLLDLVYPHAPPPHQPPQPPQAQQNSRGHACDKPGAGCRQQPRRDGHRAGTERLEADVAGEMEARAARDLALLPQLQPALLGWATLERLGLGEQLEAALADVAAVDAGAGGGTVRAHRGSSLGSGLGGALAGGRDCYDWVIPEVEEEPEGAAAWGASEDSNGGTGVSPGGPRRRGPLHLEATAAATEALCRLLRGDCGPPPSPVLLKHVSQ